MYWKEKPDLKTPIKHAYVSLIDGIEVLRNRDTHGRDYDRRPEAGYDRYMIYTEKQARERGIQYADIHEEVVRRNVFAGDWVRVAETQDRNGNLILPPMVIPVIHAWYIPRLPRSASYRSYRVNAVVDLPTRRWHLCSEKLRVYPTVTSNVSCSNRSSVEDFPNGITDRHRDMIFLWLQTMKKGTVNPTKAAVDAWKKAFEVKGNGATSRGLLKGEYVWSYVMRTLELMRLTMAENSNPLESALAKHSIDLEWFIGRLKEEAEPEGKNVRWALDHLGHLLQLDTHVDQPKQMSVGSKPTNLPSPGSNLQLTDGREINPDVKTEVSTDDLQKKK